MLSAILPSPLQPHLDDDLTQAGVRLFLKRDDLIDHVVVGNKFRKLKHNLASFQQASEQAILTFGGAYSNHLRAVAVMGASVGARTIGVVRGEKHLPLNWSLSEAVSYGMALDYLDRETYRRKSEPTVLEMLQRRHGPVFVIPEGGSNALGVTGCRELGEEIPDDVDVVVCPCGTGGTLAGLSAGLRDHQRALGVAVLKGAGFLVDDVRRLQAEAGLTVPRERWSIDLDHHHGGFAKSDHALEEFAASFETQHGLRLERIYVAKMMSAVYDLVRQGAFPRGTTIAAVITG